MRKYISVGAAPLTNIREGTVRLSKWSVMDGSEAKRVFAEKTLAECSQHLYTTLDVPQAEWMKRDMHSPIGFWPKVAADLNHKLHFARADAELDGYMADMNDEPTPTNTTPTANIDFDDIASSISSFEWLAHVHEIFNAILMNTDLLLSWDNINM